MSDDILQKLQENDDTKEMLEILMQIEDKEALVALLVIAKQLKKAQDKRKRGEA